MDLFGDMSTPPDLNSPTVSKKILHAMFRSGRAIFRSGRAINHCFSSRKINLLGVDSGVLKVTSSTFLNQVQSK